MCNKPHHTQTPRSIATSAHATVIPNEGGYGFTSVTLDKSTVNRWERIEMSMTWAVPDSATAGDQIVQDLPEILNEQDFPPFDITDSSGRVIAHAAVVNGQLVFTFTNYIDQYSNVSGSAHLSFAINRDVLPEEPGSYEYDIFGETITIVVEEPCTENCVGEDSDKYGEFNPDETTATALDADGKLVQRERNIVWYLALHETDWVNASLVDTHGSGSVPNCESVDASYVDGVRLQYSDGTHWWRNLDPAAPPAGVTAQVVSATCAGNTVTINLSKDPGDTYKYRLAYFADFEQEADGTPIWYDDNGQKHTGLRPSYTNHVEVTLDGVPSGPIDGSAVRLEQGGEGTGNGIDIEKYSGSWDGVQFDDEGHPVLEDGQPTPQPDGDYDSDNLAVEAGAPTPVTFTITNTGTEDLTNVTVTDTTESGPALQDIQCTFPDGSTGATWDGPFVIGATFDCTATLPPMSDGDVHRDTATVTGTGATTGTTITDSDEWGAQVAHQPAIDIEKYSGIWDGVQFDDEGHPVLEDGQPTPQPDGDHDSDNLAVEAGAPTPVTFTITNTGTEDLTNVTVTDTTESGPALQDIQCTFPDGSTGTTWDGPFISANSFICTATLPGMHGGDIHRDEAAVTGTGMVTGTEVSDADQWGAQVPAEPSIDIEKYSTDEGWEQGALGDHDTADDARELEAGASDPITMTIVNTGNQPLVNVTVSDLTGAGVDLTDLSCTFPDESVGTAWPGPFMPGTSFDCTGTIPGQSADATHNNTATVSGTPAIIVDGSYLPQPDASAVTDSDEYHSTTPPASIPPVTPSDPPGTAPVGPPDQPGTPPVPPAKAGPAVAKTGSPLTELLGVAGAMTVLGTLVLIGARRSRRLG